MWTARVFTSSSFWLAQFVLGDGELHEAEAVAANKRLVNELTVGALRYPQRTPAGSPGQPIRAVLPQLDPAQLRVALDGPPDPQFASASSLAKSSEPSTFRLSATSAGPDLLTTLAPLQSNTPRMYAPETPTAAESESADTRVPMNSAAPSTSTPSATIPGR